MNNRPITARVKSGMFKTKEPLLNVGPAGVDGNNKTRTMPSPSKMKGYAMKSSPFKQSTDNAITSAETENIETQKRSEADNQGVVVDTKVTNQTPDTEGTPDVVTKKPYVGAANDACSAQYIAANGRAKCDEYKALPQKVKDEANTTTVKGTKGTKGKATTKKGTSKIYEESEGQAQSAYDRRNNARAGRRTDREVNRASRKLGKYGTYDQDGKFTQRKDLSQREIRKLGIARNALDRANKESENVQQQSLQNVGGFSGKEVKNVDRRKTKGSYTPDEQANMTDDDAKTSKTSKSSKTSSFKKPKTPSTEIGFTPMSIKELSAGLEDSSIAKMSNKGFFKKKSPMKMKYFKK